MKAVVTAVYGTVMVVLVSAMAETRTPSSLHPEALHPDVLARIEAITTYCEQADAGASAEYASRLAELVRGHSGDEIQQDRGSSAYQHAMTQAQQTLGKVAPERAARACSEYLAEK